MSAGLLGALEQDPLAAIHGIGQIGSRVSDKDNRSA